MYKILKRRELNPTVTLMEIEAPAVAKKAEPGQFIILRVDEDGERIPLTVADFDRERGSVTIIFQIVGATTAKLNHKKEGESIAARNSSSRITRSRLRKPTTACTQAPCLCSFFAMG